MRELKGRPFTGAWIETLEIIGDSGNSTRRPFTGAWIETLDVVLLLFVVRSPLHGGVD